LGFPKTKDTNQNARRDYAKEKKTKKKKKKQLKFP
jgi:hypothetical protein